MIDIPSVTGDEAEVGRFLASYLERLGYRVEMQEVEANRFNIIATTAAPPRVVLSTHMDTVPPYIASSEDEEFIHGRGACDAKGIIAAQIAAAEELRKDGLREIGLLFTVDEELASMGARAANKHALASECRYLINGEPTDNMLAVGTKGALRLTLRTEGRAAHSAYPEQGDSAIEKLLDVLASVRAIRWPTNEIFGETTCNIGTLKGGTRSNVIPAEAQAELAIRLTTDAETVKKILEDAVAGRAHVEYSSAHNPVSLLALEGFEHRVVRFTTDIPYLTKWGQPLLLGPGSILVAHTEQERVAKRELVEAAELYVRMVRDLMEDEKRASEIAEGAGR
ncbi:MAG: M20/M25/M40 family metallo-hydrolase [Pyrinomonadaceae bacterium]